MLSEISQRETWLSSCVSHLRGQLMHIVIVEAGIKESVKKRGRVLSSFCFALVTFTIVPLSRSTSQGYAQN